MSQTGTLKFIVVTAWAAAGAVLNTAAAQIPEKAAPVFKDGQAQIVEAFRDSTQWIRHELWVETEFDTDGDGKRDRVHVAVVRQRQTETEGLKVPVIYESSPYFAGTSGPRTSLWNVRHEVGAQPPPRINQPPVQARNRPGISNSLVNDWVPRGFAVVHSSSAGTGLSQGCPTSGAPNETLGPKAVIDWLNGRARGFTSPTSNEQVFATWTTGKVGMIGTSYNGTLPIGVATTGVEGLEAIVPISAISSWYDYYRANGAVRAPGGFQGEDLDVLAEYTYTRPDQIICRGVIADIVATQDRVTGDYTPFWDARDYMNDIDNVRAASLVAHGNN